jgi:hypothetical protein
LVSHGRVNCARCWPNDTEKLQESGPFRLVRDPGHWGATDPHTLVLGISKGNTQSKAISSEPFEAVGFKGIRHRMLQVFQAVGILPEESEQAFEKRFTASELDFAFASVVRCSVTGMDRKKGFHTADSPNVLPAFRIGSVGSKFVENCVDQHLVQFSPRTRLVLLLGNTDSYIAAMSDVISRRRGRVSTFNPMAYVSNEVLFVHLAHPSKGNGHFGSFIRGQGTAGNKRDLARQALTGISRV